MSEMTRCNRCNFLDYKRSARREGRRLVKGDFPDDQFGMGGVTYYSLPKGMTKRHLAELSKKKREKYFVAWFGALTDSCCC